MEVVKKEKEKFYVSICSQCGNIVHQTCLLCRNSTAAIAWRLNQCETNLLSSPTQLYDDASDSEAVLGKHPRDPVRKGSLEPNGEYRAICKLFITFEGACKVATGWCCIENGFIATAGHCVYDEEYGRAIAIKAHLGYHGTDSDLRKTHEVQMAAYVAVHQRWCSSFSRENDIALIWLLAPFDKVIPLKWKDCPVKGEESIIQVVGYPLDIPGGREGQYMYKSIGPTNWDLEENPMLIHRLDTFPGNSGSPVLHIGEDHELIVIGIQVCTDKIPCLKANGHCFNGTGKLYRVNKAVAIGHNGNNLDELQQTIYRIALRRFFGIAFPSPCKVYSWLQHVHREYEPCNLHSDGVHALLNRDGLTTFALDIEEDLGRSQFASLRKEYRFHYFLNHMPHPRIFEQWRLTQY